MTASEAERCLSNNLDWYRSVLAPHGLAGVIADGLWTCHGRVPPYYSNAITVSADGREGQHRGIAALAGVLRRPVAVKDSFASLDLEPLGFRPLFTAQWIWREAAPVPATAAEPWQAVTDWDGLSAWEAAWRENGSPAATRVFLPGLLEDPSVRLFARYEAERIVAGVAANRSLGVVGLSNLFSAAPRPERDLAEAVSTIATWTPGSPVVGFEHGPSLDTAGAAGFRAVGPLKVWLREMP
jgi:hypothetical protein